ncbi:hypothetical protein A2U01_0118875, partial [Trifolium medium]|nr:hypothetical protein [Trifolium medium]
VLEWSLSEASARDSDELADSLQFSLVGDFRLPFVRQCSLMVAERGN